MVLTEYGILEKYDSKTTGVLDLRKKYIRIIKASAFENCKKTEIKLPIDDIEKIDEYAFTNCKNLEEIELPQINII